MKRRRRIHETTPVNDWRERRDFDVPRAIRAGLGMRPAGWWKYEAERPDLAQDASLDAYAHLADPRRQAAAAERLRFLVTHRQLTRGELEAIFAAEFDDRQPYAPAKQWRIPILRDAGINHP